ncbi:hypothetical protein [Microbacterium sp. NC79]|uniref:hypothetical protein n=1 Tax=Microbacterium sp. NC79 TaxID=2851009 RepID=UPI001C2CA6CB|nr:hypothetical protein [Microbacterium sp. NC79]MBV0896173.1 hypothetical protein [Microbacterium sp. NC79]
MYAALWRALPGPAIIRILILLIGAAAIVYGLFYFVFPWVAEILPQPDSTIE